MWISYSQCKILLTILPSVSSVGTVRVARECFHAGSDTAVKQQSRAEVEWTQQRPFCGESGRFLLHLWPHRRRDVIGRRGPWRPRDRTRRIFSVKKRVRDCSCRTYSRFAATVHCTSARLRFSSSRNLQWPFFELFFFLTAAGHWKRTKGLHFAAVPDVLRNQSDKRPTIEDQRLTSSGSTWSNAPCIQGQPVIPTTAAARLKDRKLPV